MGPPSSRAAKGRGSREQRPPQSKIIRPDNKKFDAWGCTSVIDRQSAFAVGKVCAVHPPLSLVTWPGCILSQCKPPTAYLYLKVLEGERNKRGANIKSLTLGPQVQQPRATYAVTCETLKWLPVIQPIVEESSLLRDHERLRPEVAYVLASGTVNCTPTRAALHLLGFSSAKVYEVLFGQGIRKASSGASERAVLAAEDGLRASLKRRMTEAGAREARELLPKDRLEGPPPRPRQGCQLLGGLLAAVAQACRLPARCPQDGASQPAAHDGRGGTGAVP